MIPYNTLVVLSGVGLLGACAGMVGAFAVLRKRSLTGDALAHAALPGICLAFLILGERNLTFMLLGALATGVIGNMVIAALVRWTRVKEDAAIGTVLTVFYGCGVVLMHWIQKSVTTGSKAGLDSYILGKTAGMTASDVYLILGTAVVCLAIVMLLYKEFQVVAFDGGFARSLGWPVYWLDLLLMTLVAVAVVIGLPAVGVVLMAALLIMPGAAARFWTNRLSSLLMVAAGIGLATGVLGTILSSSFTLMPAGPIIVLVGAAFFLVSLLFGTKRGLVLRLWRQQAFSKSLLVRKLLRVSLETVLERPANLRALTADDWLQRATWSGKQLERAIQLALQDDLLQSAGAGRYELTDHGWERGIEIVRGHRLWQELLAEYPELAGSVADLASPSIDPVVSPAVVNELIDKLRTRGRWPQLPADVSASLQE